jgi:tetratricopeptide (TPR) repeat protein
MNLGTAELAQRLQVAWLVECRVAQQGGRLGIDTGIVDVSTDESEALVSQDVESFEIFDVLDMTAEAILSRFGLSPARGAREQIANRYPASARAFDSYLKGEQALRAGTADAFREAREQFEDAQIVEGFDLARIREADAMMALIAIEPQTSAAGLTAALRAVSLILDQAGLGEYPSADLYAAKLRLANLLDQFDPQSSATGEQRHEWFEAAVALKPNYADPYRLFADYLAQAGKTDEAIVYRTQAEQLDPAGLSGS